MHDCFGAVEEVSAIYIEVRFKDSLVEDDADLQLFILMRDEGLPVVIAGE